MTSSLSEPDDFIVARHAQFNTDEKTIFDLVKKVTHCTPTTRQKIVRGNDNEVYIVKTDEHQDFIVRTKRYGELSLAQESWAITLCKEAGVRVPEVRFVGTIESESEPLEVMIQNAVSGQPLSDLAEHLSEHDFHRALHQAGEELAKIHSITVQGFYHYDLEHGWDFCSWSEIGNSMVQDRSKERDLIVQNGFTEPELDVMVQLLILYRDRYVCREPVLCHGDYIPGHLFYNEQVQLTGIIDFGLFQGGPRVHDLSMYSLNRSNDELQHLLHGYRGLLHGNEEFQARLHLHTLSLAMGFLAYETSIDNTGSAQFTAKRLRETFNWCVKYI